MRNLLFIALFSISSFIGAQPRLIDTEITETLLMKVPAELTKERPTMQRTTSEVIGSFIDQSRQADLTINKSQLRWPQADAELLSQFYKANILNIYDQVNMLNEGIRKEKGREFIYFEFVGTIVDEPNAFKTAKKRADYTYIQYTIVPGGVYVFRFTAPQRRQAYWQKLVTEAMESVVFKPAKK